MKISKRKKQAIFQKINYRLLIVVASDTEIVFENGVHDTTDAKRRFDNIRNKLLDMQRLLATLDLNHIGGQSV